MKKGLGKGLGALISSADTTEEIKNGVLEIRINDIEPNVNQPRKNFDDEKLGQLAESIKQHGIVQPLIVVKEGNIYRIVAGERRWRAARLAGLNTVPVVVKDMSSRQVMEIALIENIQREDLNAIEEAEAYQGLLEEYQMTQEELSKTVGKSRSAIANSIRLLGLCTKVKQQLIANQISSGHARTLLSIENKELQSRTSDEIIQKQLSVRDTEKLVKRVLTPKPKTEPKFQDENVAEIEDRLKNFFGTKVKLQTGNKRGKILIEYYSDEELDRIIELIENYTSK